MTRFHKAPSAHSALALVAAALLAGSLTACGGGATDPAAMAAPAADSSTDATTASIPAADAASASAAAAALDAQLAQTSASPTFHMAPALPDEPSLVDVGGTNASAHQPPHTLVVDASVAGLETRGLTPQILAEHLARAHAESAQNTAPAATTRSLTGATYTPAQIRAAYGLVALPAVGTAISAATAATLGAGQTIYIIDAYHDATALADLNSFSTRFGLPTCTGTPVATTAAMPLARAPSTCTLSVVYATAAAGMTATAPAYNGGWAPESKLDVQWAHAIAPLARIVLVETVDSMTNNLLGGIGLANKMGAGVVSMSFGLADPGWAATEDAKFTTTGMTYVAATGDVGDAVDWPAVSPNVLAVGGTGMDWSGSGPRYEQAWLHGGAGVSLYEALPSWQAGLTPVGGTALTKRAVADVSFNANPMTGQYIAMTLPGATALTWAAYGGTSIASPQWAGIVAVANAIRVANAKTTLGDIHSLIYKSIAPVASTYAAAFNDVVDGNDGTCTTCAAGVRYDTATGWGTPNVAALMPILTGVASTAVAPVSSAPVVPGGSFTGRVGVAFSASLGVTVPSNVTTTYSTWAAPAGLTVNSAGVMSWASPVAGTYPMQIRATTSGGTAANAYTLTISAGAAPLLTSSAALSATAGTALASTLTATNPNAATLAFAISGAPAGLAVSTSGVLTWATPVAGSYSFVETVRDSLGLSSTRTGTLAVGAAAATSPSANHAPTLPSLSIVSAAGKAMSITLHGHDADNDAMTYGVVSGAPAGLTLSSDGVLTWAAPTAGTHAVDVLVRDVHGATGNATLTLIVS